ncbi:MAG: FAD:protein FMN transferase [Bacilli bacterium]|nr:FAD:protein FMN transferase [Bacilli bacterium]
MNNLYKKLIGLALLIVFATTLSACGSYNGYYYDLVGAFETENQVWFWTKNVVRTDGKYNELVEKLNEELTSLDNKFNIQDRGDGIVTDLMKVNNNAGIAPVVVDKEVIDVIKLAIEVGLETKVEGTVLYDITIAPLWNLWDFPGKSYLPLLQTSDIPSEEDIANYLPLVDYKKIVINEEDSTVFLSEANMGIDLGSIVKGYAADKLKAIMLDYNIEKAIIDIGRNILLIGSAMDKSGNDVPFTVTPVTPYVSIYHPRYDELETFAQIKVQDQTIVTSGSYEKYIKDEDGNEYHHILDPRTGYPFTNNVVSLTVITDESIKGDAYSTALFSVGIEKGMEIVKSKEGLETVWVIRNNDKYEVYISEGLDGNFKLNPTVEEIGFVYKGVYK